MVDDNEHLYFQVLNANSFNLHTSHFPVVRRVFALFFSNNNLRVSESKLLQPFNTIMVSIKLNGSAAFGTLATLITFSYQYSCLSFGIFLLKFDNMELSIKDRQARFLSGFHFYDFTLQSFNAVRSYLYAIFLGIIPGSNPA